MKRACFFDVDGTLTRTTLLSAMGYFLMNQQNPILSAVRVFRQAVRSPQLILSEVLDRGLFNEQLFAAFEGMSEDRLMVLADEAVDRVLVPGLFPGARGLLDGCVQAGMEPVLISGSPDFLVQRLGARLGIPEQDCFGNRLEFRRHVATGAVRPPVLAGPAKAALIRKLAQERGYDLEASFAYSDDSADAPMLSVVGHPAAVNPKPGLRAMAQAQRWPIIQLG